MVNTAPQQPPRDPLYACLCRTTTGRQISVCRIQRKGPKSLTHSLDRHMESKFWLRITACYPSSISPLEAIELNQRAHVEARGPSRDSCPVSEEVGFINDAMVVQVQSH